LLFGTAVASILEVPMLLGRGDSEIEVGGRPRSLGIDSHKISVQSGPGFASLGGVDLWTWPPLDVRPELRTEREELLELVASLSQEEWLMPTPATRWCVRDVALHLLDDDLGWLSRGRDADMASLIPMGGDYRRFVQALDDKNQRWVDAASGLSRRVVGNLLAWSGAEVARYYDTLDLAEPAGVLWAGG